jgi:hypothetical protein
MRTLWYALLHAFIGGAATGAALIPTDTPFTGKNVALPILAAAATSVLSLLSRPGTYADRR